MPTSAEPAPPSILIEVRGGTVVAVYAHEAQKVLLLDWDEVEAGEPDYRAGEYPTSSWAELPDDTATNLFAQA